MRKGIEDGCKSSRHAHMEKISFLSCLCRAQCFGQGFSGTVTSSHGQFLVCAESLCGSILLGLQSKNTSEQKGGGKHTYEELFYSRFCSGHPAYPWVIFLHALAQRWCLWLCIIDWFYQLLFKQKCIFNPFIALLCVLHIKGGSGFVPRDCLCMWFQLISCDADGSSSCKHCGWVSNILGQNRNEPIVLCVCAWTWVCFRM